MKRLLLSFAGVVVAILTFARQKDFTETVDSLFANLNTAGATTGILYDRVFPYAGLTEFNNNYADTSSFMHFRQAYSELFRAAYSATGMTHPDTLSKHIFGKKIAEHHSYRINQLPV